MAEVTALEIKCGSDTVKVVEGDYHFSGDSYECDMCGTHGAVTVWIYSCSNCGQSHDIELTSW